MFTGVSAAAVLGMAMLIVRFASPLLKQWLPLHFSDFTAKAIGGGFIFLVMSGGILLAVYAFEKGRGGDG